MEFFIDVYGFVADPTKYSANEKEAIIRRYTSELVKKNFIGPSIVSSHDTIFTRPFSTFVTIVGFPSAVYFNKSRR